MEMRNELSAYCLPDDDDNNSFKSCESNSLNDFDLGFEGNSQSTEWHFESLQQWDDETFINKFRLSKRTVMVLLVNMENILLEKVDKNYSISPVQKLLLTLQYYGNGSFIGDDVSVVVPQQIAIKIIKQVTCGIISVFIHFIRFPLEHENIKSLANRFQKIAKFPDCIGVLSCTHIKIYPLRSSSAIYRNRMGFHSLNVQVICDPEMKFLDIEVRCPGSFSCVNVFKKSVLKKEFEDESFSDYVLLSDKGFKCEKFLMTPILKPISIIERIFNESLKRTQGVINRSVRKWKRRFPVLVTGIDLTIYGAECVIIATAILHNIALMVRDADPFIAKNLQAEVESSLNMPESSPRETSYSRSARLRFLSYFENFNRNF